MKGVWKPSKCKAWLQIFFLLVAPLHTYAGSGRSIEETPNWTVAIFFFVIFVLTILLEVYNSGLTSDFMTSYSVLSWIPKKMCQSVGQMAAVPNRSETCVRLIEKNTTHDNHHVHCVENLSQSGALSAAFKQTRYPRSSPKNKGGADAYGIYISHVGGNL